MSENKLINKHTFKKAAKQCYFCDVDNYDLLDVHRIIPGEQGGRYTEHNSIVVCALCHRKIHAGEITIDRKYNSTSGKTVLRYWEGIEEKWR